MLTPFNSLIGSWHGTGSGQPGKGTYERTYQYVLNSQFIHTRNKSIYLPQEHSPEGEVHEDWGIISYDKGRNLFVYRQFHIEGFVNQYILDYLSPDGKEFSFVTESIENIAIGWRAKESYIILTPDEFIGRFELAAPGKDFELYTECHLWREVTPA